MALQLWHHQFLSNIPSDQQLLKDSVLSKFGEHSTRYHDEYLFLKGISFYNDGVTSDCEIGVNCFSYL